MKKALNARRSGVNFSLPAAPWPKKGFPSITKSAAESSPSMALVYLVWGIVLDFSDFASLPPAMEISETKRPEP